MIDTNPPPRSEESASEPTQATNSTESLPRPRIAVRLKRSTRKAVQQAAAAHGITLSEVVRRALRDHLEIV